MEETASKSSPSIVHIRCVSVIETMLVSPSKRMCGTSRSAKSEVVSHDDIVSKVQPDLVLEELEVQFVTPR